MAVKLPVILISGIRITFLLLAVYIILCCIVYAFQEKMIFFPEKLDKCYQFDFSNDHEEIFIEVEEGVLLNGILFKSGSPMGLIFYLHGNAGSLRSWGGAAQFYTDLGYDVFMVDYRGYGKSDGKIESGEQFLSDMQKSYDEIKKRYTEKSIIVLGYSIGTGPAAHLASKNDPKLLILQAPYYSMADMLRHTYPIFPPFLLRYKFNTYEYLEGSKMPVIIFHGDQDEVIYYGSSVKLSKHFKEDDRLITLTGAGHNGMSYNTDYQKEMKNILIPDTDIFRKRGE